MLSLPEPTHFYFRVKEENSDVHLLGGKNSEQKTKEERVEKKMREGRITGSSHLNTVVEGPRALYRDARQKLWPTFDMVFCRKIVI